MTETYQAKKIETEIQAQWEEKQVFKVCEDLNTEKYYCLTQFPYPSGKLHMGHVRTYTLGDVVARQQRMLGKNVLQPMGWDAFGLPAENAAIKHKVPPAKWTYQNIKQMRAQLQRLGCAYDWSRELTSCDPNYYRWEQWLFVKMFEKGLVYRKNAVVNWDPVDQTVLANEQVKDGRGWRSGALVEQREIPQWFLKITDYADELVDELDHLSDWPEQVKTMQRNWIGRSQGTLVDFKVENHKAILQIFTTRPDTLMGATYLAIAPTHPLAKKAALKSTDIAAFIDSCKHVKVAEADLANQEKRGIATGFYATHPITQKSLPIWIANFVLMDYGPGAVMSVPAHDQRDYEFAKLYHLPIQPVIQAEDGQACDLNKAAYTGDGTLIHSGDFDGLDNQKAKTIITQTLIKTKQGKQTTHYRLRDWGISRQRYWGTPIPIIVCEHCGDVPVPESDLPVVLPESVSDLSKGSPLANMPEFVDTTCPKCHKAAKRETDTFDTFFESSWYFARFACKGLDKAMVDDRVKYWMPVDTYVGGIEHAVMHLLYSRFIYKVMRDFGLVHNDEPFVKLVTQGMVLKDGAKMSKSKGNVVDPEALIEAYGADTIRLFMIFAAPPEQSMEWSDTGVEGAHRFLKKLWHFIHSVKECIQTENKAAKNGNLPKLNWDAATDSVRDDRREIYSILRHAQYDYERLQLNTVVSSCMKLLNHLQALAKKQETEHTDYTQRLIYRGSTFLLCILNPITPHITQALWETLAYTGSIVHTPWPKVNVQALQMQNIKLVVQVNGKLRSHMTISANADNKEIETTALADEIIQRHIDGKDIKKIIVVPKKLVNIVVGDSK